MRRENKILFISGDPEQFATAIFLFRNAGYNTVFAYDNDCAALEIAGDNAPVLIISELAMPDIDSFGMCRRIRGDKRTRATPVVIVGDLSPASSIVADCRRFGASEYLQKPVGQLRLFKRCSELLHVRNQEPLGSNARQSFHSVLEQVALAR
jgi:CheY-like chemotaxis protein